MAYEARTVLSTLSQILEDSALSSSNLNDGLAFMRLYARLNWDNISGHFGNDELELAFWEKWRDRDLGKSSLSLPKVRFLHVATQTYAQGGHSRLLWQMWRGLQDHGSQALLLTNERKKNHVPDWVGAYTSLTGRAASRVADIVAAGQSADHILLHIHPDDVVAAFAARILRDQGKSVLFVNHADHVFNVGPGAADVVLEICMTGWKTTRDRRAARAQSFMGIPVVKSGSQDTLREFDRSGPIVSMGGGGKFTPSDDLSFPRFLKALLARVPNDVVLIGPSEREPWWKELTDAFPGRVHLRGPLPPEEVDPILQSASCYIDSFPLDGGTAYPQALAVGLPCFAPNEGNASGVSPSEELRVKGEDKLVEVVADYLSGGPYPFDLADVRGRLFRDFSETAVCERVLQAAAGEPVPPLPYLVPLGMRDPDYNARRWAKENHVNLPKRIWRDLSLKARLDFAARLQQAELPQAVKKTLYGQLLKCWV